MSASRRIVAAFALALLVGSSTAFAETVDGDGVVQSDHKVTIKSSIIGTIRKLVVKEGDVLREGQPIAEIENDLQRAQVGSATAEVRRAEAALAQGEVIVDSTTREYERNSKVPDLITEKQLDQSRDDMLNARANVATLKEDLFKAQQQLVVAQQALKLTVIVAPFDGVVTRLYLREGDTPRSSDTTLLDFQSLNDLYIEAAFPLPYLRRVAQGMPVRVDLEAEHPPIRTAANGRVSYVYPEVDPITRTFRVKIWVPPENGRVQPGLLARVHIDLSRKAQ